MLEIANVIKIMRTSNVFLTNILIFCDSKNESRSSILLLFVKLKILKVDRFLCFSTFILAFNSRNST